MKCPSCTLVFMAAYPSKAHLSPDAPPAMTVPVEVFCPACGARWKRDEISAQAAPMPIVDALASFFEEIGMAEIGTALRQGIP